MTYGSSYDDASLESRWEFRDTYSINLSKHEVKIGGEYNYMPYIVDDAINYLVGTYTFAQDQFFNPADAASIANLKGAITFTATSAPVTTVHPSKYSVAFVQDDWRVRPNLTLNLGLRWERLYGPRERGPQRERLSGRAPLRRRLEARRSEQLRPADRIRLGRARQRPDRGARRLRPLLRPHPDARRD